MTMHANPDARWAADIDQAYTILAQHDAPIMAALDALHESGLIDYDEWVRALHDESSVPDSFDDVADLIGF